MTLEEIKLARARVNAEYEKIKNESMYSEGGRLNYRLMGILIQKGFMNGIYGQEPQKEHSCEKMGDA